MRFFYLCRVKNKKLALVILDGWGYGHKDKSDAIFNAKTPFFDSLLAKYPHATLQASGIFVGLPDGQMGNSEVGHMNLGAGRVVYQELGRIHKVIEDGELAKNPVLIKAFEYAKQNHKKLHFIGLVSDGGVHAHIRHLEALCEVAHQAGVSQAFVHAFLDGRDTDPHAGLGFIQDLQKNIAHTNVTIASVIGRYYAMDRDHRWERIQSAYDLLIHGIGVPTQSVETSIQLSYEQGITDEFVKPIVVTHPNGRPVATIENGDVVICFNFRTDRGREITMALTQQDFPDYHMRKMNLHYVTFTNYDDNFKNVEVVFLKDDLSMTLGEVLENHHKKQIRIAETEKYPHVTFFFSGGREKEFEGEKRILIPSPKVATYDLQPEMSAEGIRDAIVEEFNKAEADFVCLNFANPDMVGHTGVYEAVVKAVETVDACLKTVVEVGVRNGYDFIVLADHGNADFMLNDDGTPNTAHSTNVVPCILVSDTYSSIKNGKLADVAPTILQIMDLSIPEPMTGVSLLS